MVDGVRAIDSINSDAAASLPTLPGKPVPCGHFGAPSGMGWVARFLFGVALGLAVGVGGGVMNSVCGAVPPSSTNR